MDDSEVQIKISTPNSGSIKKTITDHTDMEDLIKQMQQFVEDSNNVINSGERLSVTCSKCCVGISFSNCFKASMKNKVKVKTKIKTDVKTGDNSI